MARESGYKGRQRDLESSLHYSSAFSSRTFSIASELSVHSDTSVSLIGWSYQRTKEGEYVIKSKDQFKDRYVNVKVEEELLEFKDEI